MHEQTPHAAPAVEVPGSSQDILRLVRRALDEFDDHPLEVTLRRTIRIAHLLGESHLAIRLSFELKPTGGHPPANAADTRRLMVDPSTWGNRDSTAETAVTEYMADRAMPDTDKLMAWSISELQLFDRIFEDARSEGPSAQEAALRHSLQSVKITNIARHRAFAALCDWERQLVYAGGNEAIFQSFQRDVDALLARGAPAVLDQFNAAYRALRDAARSGSAQGTNTELLSQCITSCRRILKAVVDHVQPSGAVEAEGVALGDAQYRNRLQEFLKHLSSESLQGALMAAESGLHNRFKALDKIANKGVRADVALAEAEYCVINTYILAGEVLRLRDDAESGP